jgi:pyridoxamine 5'-phosphate oxidase
MVLLKSYDEQGFVFYSNRDSQKGRELDAVPKGALVFHWKSLTRQVRLRGPIAQVADAEADAYFATRPRLAQIGAWASKQSAPLESRMAFEKAVAVQTARFGLGTVPRPDYWIGYRVTPLVIEFWADRPFRLHDRVEFRRSAPDAAWSKTRLYP